MGSNPKIRDVGGPGIVLRTCQAKEGKMCALCSVVGPNLFSGRIEQPHDVSTASCSGQAAVDTLIFIPRGLPISRGHGNLTARRAAGFLRGAVSPPGVLRGGWVVPGPDACRGYEPGLPG